MAILLHGTTLARAEKIVADSPDPAIVGPDGFSTYLEQGPFLFGTPEQYARSKSALPECRDDRGPAILAVDVPDDIIALAVDQGALTNCGQCGRLYGRKFVRCDRS